MRSAPAFTPSSRVRTVPVGRFLGRTVFEHQEVPKLHASHQLRPTSSTRAAAPWRVIALAAALTCVSAVARAQFDLSWFTVDGGGGMQSTGGTFTLAGTIGQPDAGVSAGGTFVLHGGFWYGGSIATGVADGPPDPTGQAAPRVFRMYDSAPNPFNPRTQIAFDLPRPGPVRLAIYNLRGALVRTLLNGVVPAGHHATTWDGTDDAGAAVASGVYVVKIDAEPHHAQQKLVLLK